VALASFFRKGSPVLQLAVIKPVHTFEIGCNSYAAGKSVAADIYSCVQETAALFFLANPTEPKYQTDVPTLTDYTSQSPPPIRSHDAFSPAEDQHHLVALRR
jgi:hypothetical protein